MNNARLSAPTRLVLSSTVLLATLLPAATALAQPDDGLLPFECTGDAYTVRANPAMLFRINQDVAPFVFEEIAPMLGPFGPGGSLIPVQVNNIGYDTVENVLYGVAIPVLNPGVVQDNFGIVKIDSMGQVVPVPSALPGGVRFLAGDVSTDGSTMYMNTYPSGANMYVVDLDTLAVTPRPLIGGPVSVADWAYNPVDGMLYGAVGVGNPANDAPIYKLDPGTGVISLVGNPPGLPLTGGGDGQYYGGAWFNQFGELFVYRNSDWIYQIDLSGPTVLDNFEGDAGSSQFNDAAACAAKNPTVDKFYTHTWNDWSLRCVEWETDLETGVETCIEYRLPNVNEDDDIFADNLPQNDAGQFVLIGNEGKKKTVVTPGQYIAVSNIMTLSTQDVLVQEDFSDCTDIGTVNPFSVPGGVQVVLVDPDGNVHDIDDELAAGIGGYIVLNPTEAWVFVEGVPAFSTLRVMVKFQPSDELGIIGLSCTNHEIIYDEDGEEVRRASAGLVIE